MSSSTSPEQAPQSPDCVPGPEHPPSPEYVPGPEYPEYVAPSDDEIPVEDQPLPVDASPTALSPGYVADSDPEEDLFIKKGGSSSKEDEEHLTPTDSAALPVVDPIPSATPPPPPRSPQTRVPFSQTRLLHNRATDAIVQLRGTSPLPVPSPPLLLPSADHMGDIPETDMSFWKRLYLTALASRFEVGESSTATTARQTGHTLARRVDYGFIDTMDASIRASKSRVMTVVEEVNKRVTDLATTQRQDAHELYQDVVYARQAWSRSKDRSTTLEALIMAHEARTTTLEAQTRGLQREVSLLQR
ncbi:hypothetical protein Tco_0664020 [Tanacetum coccineum]